MKFIIGGAEVKFTELKNKYLVASSKGSTWYLFDATTNTCTCPAGQRDLHCHHADEVKQYRLEHKRKGMRPKNASTK